MSHEDGDSSVFEIPSLLLTASYLGLLASSGVFLAILTHFWGDHLLRSFSSISRGDISNQGLGSVWFIFAWAFATTILVLMIGGQNYSYTGRTIRLFKGVWASLNAGIFEELVFRYVLFLTAMIMLPFFNFITFGLVKFIYTVILVPIANICTFGALQSYLVGGSSRVLGAAIISVNSDFRDGHKYLGFFGWVNSWFIGMVMFYLLLNYNLQTAIAAHVLYDLVIFGISALAVQTPRRSGYSPIVWNTGWDR